MCVSFGNMFTCIYCVLCCLVYVYVSLLVLYVLPPSDNSIELMVMTTIMTIIIIIIIIINDGPVKITVLEAILHLGASVKFSPHFLNSFNLEPVRCSRCTHKFIT
jgi:hypothetical protein